MPSTLRPFPRARVSFLIIPSWLQQSGNEGAQFFEGVESALSAAAILRAPARTALTVHNLSLLRPPSGVKRLIVAADVDAVGRAVLERAAGVVDANFAFRLGFQRLE